MDTGRAETALADVEPAPELGYLALGALMLDLDLRLLFAVYGGAHGAWAPTMTALTLAGGGWATTALVPLLGWSKTRRNAAWLTAAILVQATIVWALKRAIGRVRPWLALGLPPPLGSPHDGSFPSGHASGSFCVAAFLLIAVLPGWATRPPDGRSWRARAWSLLVLLTAALVALSRIYLGAHFPSDVACGALVGTLIGGAAGKLCTTQACRKDSNVP